MTEKPANSETSANSNSRPVLPPVDETDYDDPKRPLLQALKYGSVALLGVTVLLLVIWGFVAGLPGIWGVLVSAAISGVFILATAGLVLASANTSPSTTGAIVFGGLLIKIAVLLPVLYGLSRLHFYDTWAFFTTTLVTLIVVIGAEVWGVITARVQTISRHI